MGHCPLSCFSLNAICLEIGSAFSVGKNVKHTQLDLSNGSNTYSVCVCVSGVGEGICVFRNTPLSQPSDLFHMHG
jgi:hypothetical protein